MESLSIRLASYYLKTLIVCMSLQICMCIFDISIDRPETMMEIGGEFYHRWRVLSIRLASYYLKTLIVCKIMSLQMCMCIFDISIDRPETMMEIYSCDAG